ncbi:hypothetical protein [Pontibacter liquoris]|uniref:hypothetical protein n=1 Tax=Pontibacter liquoris TaxID=2905677 RepID=UPI001FA72787|nr:hypothetical protein [Pontibacter liquoris]
MAKFLSYASYVLTVLFCLTGQQVAAQTENTYTSGNTIFLTIEGTKRLFDFSSNKLLVNYNKETQKLECVLDVSSLLPLTDNVPPEMAYEILYGAKFPNLYFEIDLPAAQVKSQDTFLKAIPRVSNINLQGVLSETVIPLVIAPDQQALVFSTNFDLLLQNFQVNLPVKYVPLLTGRLLFTIRNARWTDLTVR